MNRKTVSLIVYAIAIVFGLQLLRVFLPSISWYLGEVLGASVPVMSALFFGPFLIVFLLPRLLRRFSHGQRLMLFGTALAVLRVAEQAFHWPLADLIFSFFGTLFFMGLLAELLENDRELFFYGLFSGFTADALLHGATHTLDWSWIQESWPLAVIIVLALVLGAGLLWLKRNPPAAEKLRPVDRRAFIALGPWLFFELLILQNQGWIASVTGITSQEALLFMAAGNGMAIFLAMLIQKTAVKPWFYAILAVVCGVGFLAPQSDTGNIILILVGMIFTGFFMGLMLHSAKSPFYTKNSLSGRLFFNAGLIIFSVSTILYYVPLKISLDLPYLDIFYVNMGMLAAATLLLIEMGRRRQTVSSSARSWTDIPVLVLVGHLMLVLMMTCFLFRSAAVPVQDRPDAGSSLRVMTYNLHSAFNVYGAQDPEAIARVIEQSGADVINLQEVSRGWLITGGTDLYAWLVQRLRMPYSEFYATADPVWGVAVLSRYPIISTERGMLPQLNTIIRRGYLGTEIQWGPRTVFNLDTHLTAEGKDIAQVHSLQTGALLRVIAGHPSVIVSGDFNMEPDNQNISRILNAGFESSWPADPGIKCSFSNPKDVCRIDWIFYSKDLSSENPVLVHSPASDHYPLITTLTHR